MNYFKSFLDDGTPQRLCSGSATASDPVIIRGLVDGTIGMAIMPPATYQAVLDTYKDAHPDKPVPFASAPFPSGTNVGTTHFGGRMLDINANTKHADEAWKLVKFLNEKELFSGAYKNQFPAQRSRCQTIDFGPGMGGFAEQIELARPWGAYASGPAAMGTRCGTLTGRAFGAALSGQTRLRTRQGPDRRA